MITKSWCNKILQNILEHLTLSINQEAKTTVPNSFLYFLAASRLRKRRLHLFVKIVKPAGQDRLVNNSGEVPGERE